MSLRTATPAPSFLREVAEALNQRKDVDIKVDVLQRRSSRRRTGDARSATCWSIQGVVSQAISLYQVLRS